MTQPITDPSRLHAHAIHDLLSSGLTCTVYLGEVTDTAPALPYLIVWPPPAQRIRENLAGNLSSVTTVTQLTAVGQNVDEVLATLDRAAGLLQGTRPDLPGRKPGQIHQSPEFTPPPVTQSDVTRTTDGRPVYRGIDQYRLYSTPAASA
jgi:hypothetical protein